MHLLEGHFISGEPDNALCQLGGQVLHHIVHNVPHDLDQDDAVLQIQLCHRSKQTKNKQQNEWQGSV